MAGEQPVTPGVAYLRHWLPIAMLFLLAMLPGTLFAQAVARGPAIVLDREGRKHSGVLRTLASGRLALVGTGQPQGMATSDLVSLKWPERKSNALADDPVVVLVNGDVLALRVDTTDDAALTGRWARFPTWPPLKVPTELVRGIIFARGSDAAADARLWARLADHREPHDLVVLANRDSVTGEFVSLSPKALVLKGAAGKENTSLDRAGAVALVFNPELTARDTNAPAEALVSLIDGSRFRVKSVKLAAPDHLELQPLFGGKLDLPTAAVDSLRFLGGSAVPVSSLKPLEYRFQPYLELDWPWRADRSVQGGPLKLRGVTYPSGLGVHSRADLTYALDGKYRWFQATIGIDDDTSGGGSAIFEVLVDGKVAYRSEALTGTSAPLTIEPVKLTDAKRLTLRVDFGPLGDIQDHANWCDAVLVK